MDLSHSFTVPLGVEAAWERFQDIGSLAECFPGAQVTSVGETEDGAPSFEGTCKVKLGPIALVYAGYGSFVERDEAARRFVVDAKGRDKRGNGTAAAKVTVTMAAAAGATQVDVATDLAITGKPAQFGRGVMQDVSDKLLGQFVACLEQRLAGEPGESGVEGVATVAEPAATPPPAPDDDTLDLGSALLPILVKSHGKQIAAALLALVGLVVLLRRLRR